MHEADDKDKPERAPPPPGREITNASLFADDIVFSDTEKILFEEDLKELSREVVDTINLASSQENHTRPYPDSSFKNTKEPGFESFYYQDEPATDESSLKAGDLVLHKDFGKGIIQHIEGSGEKAKALINFGSGGLKKLILKYAKLHKI